MKQISPLKRKTSLPLKPREDDSATPLRLNPQDYQQIAAALKSGAVVGLPTETVYGLAVCLDSLEAIERLMRIKDRDFSGDKVFTLIPETPAAISRYAIVPGETDTLSSLIRECVPGPLTILFAKSPAFSHPYFDHFDKVGVRIPDTPLFSHLLKLSGPLLLTSANRRGRPPAPMSKIPQEFPEIDAFVAEDAAGRAPSTVYDATTKQVIRQGDVKLI